MLSLAPPYLMVDGVSVFPDHADPLQFYFLPQGPRIVTRLQDGRRVPHFNLVKFKGGAGPTGGVLSFDVDLSLDDGVLADVADGVRSALHLRDTPRLAPVPLESGTVRLLLLGTDAGRADDPAGGPPPDAGPERFHVTAHYSAQPALYGANTAAFSVRLDQDGVVLMDRVLAPAAGDGGGPGGMALAPIGVVYALDYIGLRPAYNVRLDMDWDRIKKHFDDTFSTSTLFVDTDITTVVDKLIEDQVIVVEVDTLVLDTEENKGLIAGRDAAVAQVYDMITDAFFTASLNPTEEAADGWDKAARFFDRLSPASQAKSLVPHFTYTSTDLTRIDRKKLTMRLSERAAVSRAIYPQGHLSGIAELIADSGLPRTDFVREVDLDDPWFRRRTVEVVPRIDFATGHVASATVDLRYGGQTRSVLIDATHQTPSTVDWTSQLVDGRMVEPVEAEVTLNLTAVEDLRRPQQLRYTPEPVRAGSLEVRTEDLFLLETIPVLTDGVPWDRWSHVEVAIRYVDEAHGIRQESVFDLSAQVPAWNYKVYVVDPDRRAVEYRLTYHGIGRQDATFDWRTSTDGQVRIGNPYSVRRDVSFAPAVNWAEVARIFVDARYADPANGVLQEQSFEFTEGDGATRTFTVDLRDPHRRRVEYAVTMLRQDGIQHVVPDSATEDNRVLLSSALRGRQVVTVAADVAGAAADGVAGVSVTVTPAGGVPVVRTFASGSPPAEIGFDFDADPAYTWEAVITFTNGRRRVIAASESREPTLTIPLT